MTNDPPKDFKWNSPNKNVGHFQLKTVHDPFQYLVVPEHAHILS